MNEQLLKDLVETAKVDDYNWDIVLAKFPELGDYDVQLLKDYVETATQDNYDYSVVNSKFPEFELGKTNGSADATSTGGPNVTGSESDDGSLESPKDGKDVVKNLINIDNNTTYEKDTDLKQSILERYFEAPDVDLSKIEGAKTIDSPMGQGVDWSTIKFEDAATASEDQLKEYFGEEKYNYI